MKGVNSKYLVQQLKNLLAIPSPAGYTDEIVRYAGEELEKLGISIELTRRGAIRATLPGEVSSPDRAIVVHLDTIGAMVRELKPNGRIALSPVGTWSSRFAEGARVNVLLDSGKSLRGTILPMKASGHVYNEDVDTQKSSWDHVELRVDELLYNDEDLRAVGIQIGDFVAVDPRPEFSESGFINSRHLDDKAGVAAVLAMAKLVMEEKRTLPTDVHLLFTISEEVGSGCSAVLHQDVAEMVTIDNATPAPGQNSKETGVTIAMKDQVGPFDYHLTRRLLDLCKQNGILHQRDVFRYYRSDSASAIEAGNDIRTALVCFGVDASHGYERTHLNSLESLAGLLLLYVESEPLFLRDRKDLAPLDDFALNADHHQGVPVDENDA